MAKKTDKYTSAEMQNEIIKIMALQVLRKIAASLRDAPFYTIMVDETADISNQEHMVVCIRWVTSKFKVHEEFIGMYGVNKTDSSTILSVIKEVLQQLNLSLNKLSGQCYDGAGSMAGAVWQRSY